VPAAGLAIAVAVVALAIAAPASASYLVDRNATHVRLKVDAAGHAIVTYRAGGRWRHLLAWGAVNARAPSLVLPQVRFHVDYSGGWGAFRRPQFWLSMRDACRPYRGPKLPLLVAACTAPDGSFWALQRWQRLLPNHGLAPRTAAQSASELHLSHWSGRLPRIQVYQDWVYDGRFHHLFGRLVYHGRAVYGFRSSSQGAPMDSYGRNVYLDTFDSAYGKGWRRENGFLTSHRPGGNFCYGFFPHGSQPPGYGLRYRVTALGPGVTPIVRWEGRALGGFDPRSRFDVRLETRMNALEDRLAGLSVACRRH
jgi:hypothetical protein